MPRYKLVQIQGIIKVYDNILIPDDLPKSIEWKEGRLYFLDQTLLPHHTIMEEQESAEQVYNSIKQLKVRGAPAIGVGAAYGLCVGVKNDLALSMADFKTRIKKQADYLNSARPTAVNLHWAMQRMVSHMEKSKATSTSDLYDEMVTEAQLIHNEDKKLSIGMAETGQHLIKEGMGIMTHCNAGSLATSILGTATAPLYLAHSKGLNFKVYANETRPLLQGARLTAWELQQSGIDVTLLTDNMAAHMMATGHIDMVIVGTDRVVANGDVANKIGTLGVAILAKYYDIPFYVACPSSTIDLATKTGKDIPIEERSGEEVKVIMGKTIAPANIQTRCPAFDVTPHSLVTGIVTETKLIQAPYGENIKLFMELKEKT